MVTTTKPVKKITSAHDALKTKTKRKRKIKSQKPDTAERWLSELENFLRPCQAESCTNPKDEQTLRRILSKKLVRLSVLVNSDFMGVDWFDYNSLCTPCKTSVHQWYFYDVFPEFPDRRTSEEIFSLMVKRSSYKELTKNAETRLDTMCREKTYSISEVSREEIVSQERYFVQCKAILEFTEKQLRECVEEQNIESRGGRVE